MKKIVLVFISALLIGGCGLLPTAPALPTQPLVVESPTTAPTETQTALPTDTAAPLIETFTATADVFLNPTITPFSPGDLTTTPITATLETTVDAANVAAATTTPTALSFPSSVTPSPTLGILTYGTLPPKVPSSEVILSNKAKVEAYISLQNQEDNGAILEYPVKGQFSIRAPLGQYIYVAWVGGNKMTGSFKLGGGEQVTIYLFKDKVVIDK
jgi:hypothetical protein